MAKNEDGEFELVLGNRQLLSVFFLVVVLLGLCFLIGYVFGRNSAPLLAESGAPAAAESREPLVVTPAGPAPAPEARPEPASEAPVAAAPTKTAPQQPPVSAAAKPAPPPPTPKAAAPPAAGSQPVPGRIYLQLSAIGRDEADLMVDLLRARKFTALAAEIPERPGTFRVLVGPLEDSAVAKTRADLKAADFPSDEAIRRVF